MQRRQTIGGNTRAKPAADPEDGADRRDFRMRNDLGRHVGVSAYGVRNLSDNDMIWAGNDVRYRALRLVDRRRQYPCQVVDRRLGGQLGVKRFRQNRGAGADQIAHDAPHAAAD